jgi:hypothetical protein
MKSCLLFTFYRVIIRVLSKSLDVALGVLGTKKLSEFLVDPIISADGYITLRCVGC